MPSSGLLAVASSCRESDTVSIIDEKVFGPCEAPDADLVAISFKTMDCSRAYHLADECRSRGVPVVLGGAHATLRPQEALAHADSVVLGEGEAVWPRVLRDLEAGRLAPRYDMRDERSPLTGLKRQRIELVDHRRYSLHSVMSARGCSFECEFCPTASVFGKGYRLRDARAVISEIEALLRLEDKPVFFSENVFGAGDPVYIETLMAGLFALGARFGVICDWYVLDERTVGLLAEGGCALVCLNLTGRIERAEMAALEAIRAAGLAVWGYVMFGFEEDTPDVFERAIRRAREYELRCVSPTVLTPFPGTPMGDRLAREGRILCEDMSLYDHVHVLFEPKGMTALQLEEGFAHVVDELGDLISFERAVEAIDVA